MSSMLRQLFTAPSPSILKKKVEPTKRTYSDFIHSVRHREVQEIVLRPDTQEVIYVDDDGHINTTRIFQNQELWRTLHESESNIVIDIPEPKMGVLDFVTVLFMGVFTVLAIRAFTIGSGMGGMASKETYEMDTQVVTRFDDVEGIDSARDELSEIVDFLKNPMAYTKAGASIPRGCLLEGPPGCGKTLLAKAIAGESEVPFISVSGSQFIELFVGMGAKRVRDLFSLARTNAPCIVFIDEIDAVGKQRGGSGGFGSNDEREQTVNQLLTEMDGFDDSTGVIVLAATNRADMLDTALVRSGRFDRKIQINLPGVEGRERILRVHSRDKNLSEDVILKDWAKSTTGFSGADLQSLLNESAIRSVRDNGDGVITREHIEDAYQRMIVGAKSDTIMSDEKKTMVSYHESGHALMGAVLYPHYDKLRAVSILPRGDSGGVTYFQPEEDGVLETKFYYENKIRVLLAGRIAEQVVFGEERVTTGASQDFAMARDLARKMHEEWHFYRYDSNDGLNRAVDDLVNRLYDEVLTFMSDNRSLLEFTHQGLYAEEFVDGDFVYGLLCREGFGLCCWIFDWDFI